MRIKFRHDGKNFDGISIGTYLRIKENSCTFASMNKTPITYRLFHTNEKESFTGQLTELLDVYRPESFPVRLVFFDNPAGKEEYCHRLCEIKREVRRTFPERTPVISYVAQAPCRGGMIMEVHEWNAAEAVTVTCSEDYLTVEHPGGRHLFMSVGSLSRVEAVLRAGRMPVSSIVRQWNYIEDIVGMSPAGHQNYQDFNDARTQFYNTTPWADGYPAATGIGVRQGGVTIDADALMMYDDSVRVYPLDNPLQVPAHAYSQKVLLGAGDKSTPKFERGKAVVYPAGMMIYVSGTAAIRGEESLSGVGVEKQAVATLENIDYLISRRNLAGAGMNVTCEPVLQYLRVYLKRKEDAACVKSILEKACPGLPVACVLADVCRDELLIEMEGVASFRV